jgi:phage tail-like protein
MAVGREDPYAACNFHVMIQGILEDGRSARAAFSEVSGLDVEIATIEYRTGAEEPTVRKLPGLNKFTNITLKRGITGDLTLWTWLKEVMNGNVRRADGTITLLDESRQAVMTWRFRRAWPCKLSGPVLNAKSNEVAIEVLELCHEGLELE